MIYNIQLLDLTAEEPRELDKLIITADYNVSPGPEYISTEVLRNLIDPFESVPPDF